MLKTEIAELMNKDGQMFDIAQKITYNRNLSAEEKEVSDVCDAWVKEIASVSVWGDEQKQFNANDWIKRIDSEN